MAGAVRVSCYLASRGVGGMEVTLGRLLHALDERFEVTVIGASSEVLGFLAAQRSGTATALVPPISGSRDVGAVAATLAAVRRARPQVVHASLGTLYHAQYALFGAAVWRVPALAVVHGALPHAARRRDVLFRTLLRRVQVVAAVSRFVACAVEDEFALAPGSVRILSNGIEPAAAAPPVRAGRDGRRVVGAVGRCAPEKGFDVAVRAMAELPDHELVIVGDGPERGPLGTLAGQLGVEDRVSFAGWVEPPWTAARAFDVVVAPSRSEGFGLVAAEAMLAGMPVVASRLGGFAEVIEDGVTGLLVDPDQPAALAAALRRLAAEPELVAALTRRAAASVAARFTVSAMARAYEAVYDELAAGR